MLRLLRLSCTFCCSRFYTIRRMTFTLHSPFSLTVLPKFFVVTDSSYSLDSSFNYFVISRLAIARGNLFVVYRCRYLVYRWNIHVANNKRGDANLTVIFFALNYRIHTIEICVISCLTRKSNPLTIKFLFHATSFFYSLKFETISKMYIEDTRNLLQTYNW